MLNIKTSRILIKDPYNEYAIKNILNKFNINKYYYSLKFTTYNLLFNLNRYKE